MDELVRREDVLDALQKEINDIKKQLSDPEMEAMRGGSMLFLARALSYAGGIVNKVPAVDDHGAGELKWHRITERELTDEEKAYYKEQGVEWATILEGCPADGDECLTGRGTIDIFEDDGLDGCCWESGDEVEDGSTWCLLSDIIEVLDENTPKEEPENAGTD